jgi:hypothetical protein
MKYGGRVSLMAVLMVAFVAAPSLATKPGREVNPNGFPCGEHRNLNIIGKKDTFTCPEQEYDEFGNPVYGKVVFVPQNGEGIEIYMQSGKGKKAAAIPDLQAIDPCAVFDGDGAVIQLPKNEEGYRVYARALADPKGEPEMTIMPSLVSVEDESGNDLIYLGLLTSNGFAAADGKELKRTKGPSRAIRITGLFEWTGDVCYFEVPEGDYDPSQVCCIDEDLDNVYEACVEPIDIDGTLSCATEGYELVAVYCREYTDEWVFNIGDFVEYLWSVTNDGVKLINVRFYPNVDSPCSDGL